MRKTLKGSDGFGNQRTYDFEMISALTGLKIMHTYGALLTHAIPQVTALVAAWQDSKTPEKGRLIQIAKDDFVLGEGPVLELIKALPAILDTPRMIELAGVFLHGAKVEGQECDEDGMCELFRGRPHEIYSAVGHAIIANFPDYLPFLGSPDDTTDTKSGDPQRDNA